MGLLDYIDNLARKWRSIFWWHRRILVIAYAYYAIRSWDLLWFTTTNPGILGSGVRGDSKYDTLRKLRAASGSKWSKAVPTTIRVPLRDGDPRPSVEELKMAMEGGGSWERTDRGVLRFPVIAKPDLGANGWRVHRVEDMDQLVAYSADARHDFLLQEYIENEEAEINVFYYRIPGDERGVVCDITAKKYLRAVGNGRDSFETLLNSDEDAKRLQATFAKMGLGQGFSRAELDRVVPEGEVVHLGRPGNPHFWGYAVDSRHLGDPRLLEMMDDLSLGFEDGFYFGRYDIRLDVKEPLENLGAIEPHAIRILELNGIGSELLRIYSKGFTIQGIWRDCWPLWEICWRIAMRNKERGIVSYEDITLPYDVTASAQNEIAKLKTPNSSNNHNNKSSSKKRKRKARNHLQSNSRNNHNHNSHQITTEEDTLEEEDMNLSRELTHEEIWDDSALIEAWNAATEEYEAYHGPDKGWKTEPVHKSALYYNVPPAKKAKIHHEVTSSVAIPTTAKDEDEEGDSQPIDFETFVPTHDPGAFEAPSNTNGVNYSTWSTALPDPPGSMVSQDEAFNRALGAMYWSGYWTAVYHCHKHMDKKQAADNTEDEENRDDGFIDHSEEEEDEGEMETDGVAMEDTKSPMQNTPVLGPKIPQGFVSTQR
ncbi:hypothetical protein VNI00_009084 [Paramarasmius palmivorus]|uniref:Survival Motor Neuron Gemin2-binding domain-containing protein n=1 Tax=Paramarasmius palmivorus TaxID=297713 RepID=A0AAW0CRF3_9AGAR